jgi:hypothetical protein
MDSEVVLSHKEWESEAKAHRARLFPFVDNHIRARTHGVKHPVYDFLFSYYSFSSGQLLRWSPGINVKLNASNEAPLDWQEFYVLDGDSCFLDISLFPDRRLPYLEWAINYLTLTSERTPVYHCFGLHEWAMLYKGNKKQHPHVPLRVRQELLDEIVEERPLCCSHYDAFRFFSREAVPMNKVKLERETVPMHEQPGCIHANMDLYKMGYKIAPFISSELLADLFLLALRAREIDMRASPYDISEYGFKAIPIETKEGREEYVTEQKQLFIDGQDLRARLILNYQRLLKAKAVEA